MKRWQAGEIIINKTPLGITGFLIELLKDYYEHNSIQFKYSENPIESKLYISVSQQWDPGNCENYPGIFVKRNNWEVNREGKVLGNYKSFSISDDGKSSEFWVPVTSSYSIICIGKEYGELEKLLEETYLFLLCFQNPIMTDFDLYRFDVNSISPVTIYKEEKGYRVGQLDLTIGFDFMWKIMFEKKNISKWRISDGV